jgi:nicotinate-nucleotide pyrophosphorylase
MMKDNFSLTSYTSLINTLKKTFTQSKKTTTELQVAAGGISAGHVSNAFNADRQVLSDSNLTKIAAALEIDLYIVWHKGERKYYLAKNEKALNGTAVS